MNKTLTGLIAGLAVVGLMGCQVGPDGRYEARPSSRYLPGDATGGELALLDKRLTDRLNASELHIVQRLERIEANQTALMLRFGFRPEGGK